LIKEGAETTEPQSDTNHYKTIPKTPNEGLNWKGEIEDNKCSSYFSNPSLIN
jgi:hypothetical protein